MILKKLLLFLFLFNQTHSANITISTEDIGQENLKINLSFKLNHGEPVYTDSINISTNNPGLEISDWKATNILNSKKELTDNFNINLQAKIIKNKLENNSKLFVSYMLANNNEIKEATFDLDLKKYINTKNLTNNEQDQERICPTNLNNNIKTGTQAKNPESQNKKNCKSLWSCLSNITIYAQDIMTKHSSIWVQFFIAFLLGILMSFTPCIYPVIPITAGILQMQGSKSLLFNLFLSLSYAMGIATTFALFGLTAAISGNLFGSILNQPIFVIFISSFLIYLGLSMFGFYEIYIPKFMHTSNTIKQKGSPISAFLFGAISGSIASPCLSPGLALLLTIVASLGNKFLGFILLFSFGIGLSVSLIIIGTFSSSINLLPSAGMWMEETKKIFGLLLFFMSFYYLSNIVPIFIILWLIAILLLAIGIYYLYSISQYDSKSLKIFKNVFGFLFISSSIFTFTKAFFQTRYHQDHQINEQAYETQKSYCQIIDDAIKLNKKVIIDISTQYCSICKAIDKKIFHNPEYENILNNFVLVKVDATDSDSEPYKSIKNKYKENIIGVPTILIIDPKTENLLKKLGSELYDMSKQEVVDELEKVK